jgi:hypothetical protein
VLRDAAGTLSWSGVLAEQVSHARVEGMRCLADRGIWTASSAHSRSARTARSWSTPGRGS